MPKWFTPAAVMCGVMLAISPILIALARYESTMGLVQKIFYFHAPSGMVMFLSAFVCGVASAVYLYGRRASADRVALAAVAVKPLPFAWIIDDILREPLADHETNERLRAVVHRFVRRTAGWKADEVSRSDLLARIAHNLGSLAGKHIDSLVFVPVRMKLRRLVPRRDGDQMDTNILETDFVTDRFVRSDGRRI